MRQGPMRNIASRRPHASRGDAQHRVSKDGPARGSSAPAESVLETPRFARPSDPMRRWWRPAIWQNEVAHHPLWRRPCKLQLINP